VGQTLSTSVDHFESPADLSSASTALCRGALPWARGLQQNSFCSARMKNHCPRETRKAASLGSSRATWIFTWSRHASLPVSKCIHFDNGQRTHRGYSRILSPQLSTATVIIHQPVTNGSQIHDGLFTESSSALDLEVNFEHMRRAWDPQQPVETLFKQIQDCADYSEAGGVPNRSLTADQRWLCKNICSRALHERLSPLERETSR
jgi:hypothetical protein